MFEERENVQKEFEKLQFYIDNFKPIAEIDSANRDKMQKFLTDAYECHLNLKKVWVQATSNSYFKWQPNKIKTNVSQFS